MKARRLTGFFYADSVGRLVIIGPNEPLKIKNGSAASAAVCFKWPWVASLLTINNTKLTE
ncbi:MAG: hypothetical protein AAGC85_00345 [Bacteroidota bacterium]